MSNLKLYNAVRSVPENAKKRITGGRLSGMTDINPMWRIKTLTEQFGICGIGWKYVITDKRLEQGANGEIAAFVDIDLYIKIDDEWVTIPEQAEVCLLQKSATACIRQTSAKMALTIR